MEKQVTQSQVLRKATDGLRNAIYVSMPGAIVSYDATNQVANIQPMLNDPRTDVDTGETVSEPWPVIDRVPVCWPRFGGFVLAGPLAQFDPVILMAWDLDPSAWLDQGPSIKPVNPHDVRRLGGNYWRAIPANIFGPIADAAAAGTALVFGKDGDPAQIRIQAGSLQLGNAGGDFVALASKVDACMNALRSHTHAAGVLLDSTGHACTGSTAAFAGSLPATGSALVKAQ